MIRQHFISAMIIFYLASLTVPSAQSFALVTDGSAVNADSHATNAPRTCHASNDDSQAPQNAPDTESSNDSHRTCDCCSDAKCACASLSGVTLINIYANKTASDISDIYRVAPTDSLLSSYIKLLYRPPII